MTLKPHSNWVVIFFLFFFSFFVTLISNVRIVKIRREICHIIEIFINLWFFFLIGN